MSDHVYKHIRITGSSSEGLEGAIQRAVQKASESVHNLRWFEVKDIRGHLSDNAVHHWQVTIEVGFTMD